MELIVKWKYSIESLFSQILASPSMTFLATSGIFLASIIFFFLVYWFLFAFHEISILRYKDKNLIGFNIPLSAFQASDSLRKRIEVRVKNDLRLREFIGSSTNVSWQSFSQDDSLSRQFPAEGTQWRDFRDTNVLGTTPKEMVESVFKKYGILKYKILFHRENSFASIFPLLVMQEYFQVQSIEAFQKRIINGELSSKEQLLLQSISSASNQIKDVVFQLGIEKRLFELSKFLIQKAEEIGKNVEDQDRFKNIFYGEILSMLAPPQTQMEFVFDSIPLHPEPMDFLYLSTTIATSNIPGEVIPITNDVRGVIWLQLMLSYFILALNVAALIKWLKI